MNTNTRCDQYITRKLACGSSEPIMIAMSRWTGFREGIQIRGLESDSPQDFCLPLRQHSAWFTMATAKLEYKPSCARTLLDYLMVLY
jgi:hypothetical protein